MADERRLDVLRAIVEDYVATHEPVGSRSLLDRHQLGVSPATIRNDMAILEEEGYISQPHTSAGRIPTERATGSSSTGSRRSNLCRQPSAAPSRRSSAARSTSMTSSNAASAFSRS